MLNENRVRECDNATSVQLGWTIDVSIANSKQKFKRLRRVKIKIKEGKHKTDHSKAEHKIGKLEHTAYATRTPGRLSGGDALYSTPPPMTADPPTANGRDFTVYDRGPSHT